MATLKNTHVQGTGAITLPTGSPGLKPSRSNSGYIRYNTYLDCVDWYDGTKWRLSPDIIRDNNQDSGLRIYLDASEADSFGGSAGTLWKDISGNTKDFSLNGPTFTAVTGGASYYSFDGANDTADHTMDAINPHPMSVVVAFRSNLPLNTAGKILGIENTTGTGSTMYGRNLYVDTSGSLRYGVYDGSVVTIASDSNINDNTWKIATVVQDRDATLYMYINGELQSSYASAGAPQAGGSQYWRLGGYKLAGWTNGADGYFQGDISVVLIYHRELSPEEADQNFQALRGRFGI